MPLPNHDGGATAIHTRSLPVDDALLLKIAKRTGDSVTTEAIEQAADLRGGSGNGPLTVGKSLYGNRNRKLVWGEIAATKGLE
jgi:hypothetical protein